MSPSASVALVNRSLIAGLSAACASRPLIAGSPTRCGGVLIQPAPNVFVLPRQDALCSPRQVGRFRQNRPQ